MSHELTVLFLIPKLLCEKMYLTDGMLKQLPNCQPLPLQFWIFVGSSVGLSPATPSSTLQSAVASPNPWSFTVACLVELIAGNPSSLIMINYIVANKRDESWDNGETMANHPSLLFLVDPFGYYTNTHGQ